MFDTTLDYLYNSSAISIIVLVLLSVYFVLLFWIFIYRFVRLNSMINSEKNALESLVLRGAGIHPLSLLNKCLKEKKATKELLNACEISLIKDASKGISFLSIIASTSPFIGLFGTVVGILESFAKFSDQASVGFSTIAPAISEALVATAAGIFVATFAYSFHQVLTRKVYELNTYLKAQSEIITSKE